jgi:primary-amine oxidase
MERIEEVAMRSEIVQKELKRLKLVEGSEIVCEPWPYGKDGIDDDERLYQVHPEKNLSDFRPTFS